MAQQRHLIKEHGWMVQGVFPTEQDPGVAFAYTIGLTAAGLPELLISGNIGMDVTVHLLNDLAKMHLREEIKPGDEVAGIANVVFHVAECGPDVEVQQARNHYGDKVRVIQIIWPDKEGRYPGDEGFADGRDDAQPLW